MRMLRDGFGLASVLVLALGVSACGGKKEPTPSERVAQVVDKGGSPAKQATKPAETTPKTTTRVAPDPAAPEPTVAKAEPAKVEPTPEPAKVEPEVAVEAAKVEPTPEPAKVEPTPEPAVEPTGTGAAMFDLTINDAALTVAIADRLPSDRKTTFTIGTDPKVYAWFEFKNPGASANVSFVWKKEGREIWRIGVDVGTGKGWRTWAEKKIGKKDAGHWTVDVIDEQGHVYQTLSYDVQG